MINTSYCKFPLLLELTIKAFSRVGGGNNYIMWNVRWALFQMFPVCGFGSKVCEEAEVYVYVQTMITLRSWEISAVGLYLPCGVSEAQTSEKKRASDDQTESDTEDAPRLLSQCSTGSYAFMVS